MTDDEEFKVLAEKYGLPQERVEGNKRFCRHHSDQQIHSRGSPCKFCWRDARGLFWPIIEEAPLSEGGPPGWKRNDNEFLECYEDPERPKGKLYTRSQAWAEYNERFTKTQDPPKAPPSRRGRKPASSDQKAGSPPQSSPGR